MADDVREQIARWLCEKVIARDRIVQASWPDLPEPIRVGWLDWADDLLAAVPAVAEALAARERTAEALDHVETLALAGPKARRQAYGEAADILRASLKGLNPA